MGNSKLVRISVVIAVIILLGLIIYSNFLGINENNLIEKMNIPDTEDEYLETDGIIVPELDSIEIELSNRISPPNYNVQTISAQFSEHYSERIEISTNMDDTKSLISKLSNEINKNLNSCKNKYDNTSEIAIVEIEPEYFTYQYVKKHISQATYKIRINCAINNVDNKETILELESNSIEIITEPKNYFKAINYSNSVMKNFIEVLKCSLDNLQKNKTGV
ncbi:MAG: hypothetical protein LCH67_08275 [Bacteroidetes bacterium]|nr:hypothetical protein [Bacteroidota bacterium]